MSDVTFLILKVVLSAAIATVSVYVVPALKTYVEEHKDQKIWGIIETAVRAAEQTVRGEGQGKFKKQKVLDAVKEQLKKAGIEITDEQLDDLIEECVYLLNNPEKK